MFLCQISLCPEKKKHIRFHTSSRRCGVRWFLFFYPAGLFAQSRRKNREWMHHVLSCSFLPHDEFTRGVSSADLYQVLYTQWCPRILFCSVFSFFSSSFSSSSSSSSSSNSSFSSTSSSSSSSSSSYSSFFTSTP